MRDEAGGPGVWPRVTAIPNREAPAVRNVRRVTCGQNHRAIIRARDRVVFGSELRDENYRGGAFAGPRSGRRGSGALLPCGPGPNRLFAGFHRCDCAARARHRRSRAVPMQPTRDRGCASRSSLHGRQQTCASFVPEADCRAALYRCSIVDQCRSAGRIRIRRATPSASSSPTVSNQGVTPFDRPRESFVRRHFRRPDRCPVTPPGSLADVVVGKATGDSTYRRSRYRTTAKGAPTNGFLSPIPASSKHQLDMPRS